MRGLPASCARLVRWPASRWLALALAIAAGGCSDSGTEPKPTGSTGITVTPKQLSLVVGGTGTLQATVTDSRGSEVRGAQVFWASADADIATVSSEGVVRALRTGTVKIAASSGGSSDVATVIVGRQPVASITVTPVSATVTVGGSTQLSVTLTDASGATLTDRTVTWQSSNPAVLTVDANGRVSALSPGVASVTATSEGRSTSASITVVRVEIGSVSVSPTSVTLTVGQTTQLGASVTDVDGQPVRDRDVRWTSSDERIATVSSSGLAIALAVGSATITATAEGKSASVAVRVNPVPVGAVVVSPSPAQLLVGQSVTLTVQITDATGRIVDRAKSFASDAPGIATVDQAGVVRGVSPGTTIVRVTSEGQVGTTTVVVSRVPVASVSVTPASASLLVGRTTTLAATPRDASGNALPDRAVSWQSTNEGVATVSQSGVVTAVGPGTAVISATAEGQSGRATVTVSPVPVASVVVSPPSSAIVVGQTTTLAATVRDEDGREVTDRAVTWTTSDPRVALVSSSGLVTAVGAGSATIAATSEGRSGSATVTVAPVPVASVLVSPSSSALTVGSTVQLTAAPRDASGNTLGDRPVSWSSSDPGVATVSGTGLVTALRPGATTITASSEGKSGSATVTVTAVPVASVDVAPAQTSVQVGRTTQLTATPRDASGNPLAGRTVTWASSNSEVASVSSTGLVTGVAPGSATITATSEGSNGSASVTVNPVPVASVAVNPPTASMSVGGSVQLTATPKDAAGNPLSGRAVGWKSDHPEIAAVDQSGNVTAVAPGSATITATSEGKSGSSAIAVTAPPPPTVTSVVISPPDVRRPVGGAVVLTATCQDASGNAITGLPIGWSLTADRGNVASLLPVEGNPSQIRVQSGGREGTATVTATCGGQRASTTVRFSKE